MMASVQQKAQWVTWLVKSKFTQQCSAISTTHMESILLLAKQSGSGSTYSTEVCCSDFAAGCI